MYIIYIIRNYRDDPVCNGIAYINRFLYAFDQKFQTDVDKSFPLETLSVTEWRANKLLLLF